ncbi:MAG: molybdopterin-synthase adenylyltransferase MoeB [Gammaproteobacteria bacterium]|nr:molybdopterin-synthase adenylyltransferase MoeB [Gammaproteobacteria bacterium]MBU1408448.1 molybdopterin-synthase adenylyltransferase MoeB [Gammaproteobacteria bacterium]MBU1532260.1 molybdopterin-synthase adenylyltransferase MoeB [Gammaproteobacteria bacterium]
MELTDDLLLRYSRHILLPQIGVDGQARICDAAVLIVGAGGLGCPVALYLGAAGVGRLVLADGDTVDLTNLQRQIGHATAAIGENKAASLARSVRAINPEIDVRPIGQALADAALHKAVAAVDLVVDASDNFATRHAVNRACVLLGKPLVSGAAIGFSGQLAVFDSRQPSSPCYHCLFPDHADEPELRCAEAGVISPLVGVIGAMQALEALKYLAGAGEPLIGRLLLWDGLRAEARVMRVPRDPACLVCAQQALDRVGVEQA